MPVGAGPGPAEPAEPAPALAAADLVAGYGRGRRARAIVRTDALAAHRGEVTAVIGANGSGKSTLLRTLVGAQPPLSGSVTVEGVGLGRLGRGARARRLAVVLTDRVEPGLLTVGEVIALGRHPHTGWRGTLAPGDRDAARRAAADLGVEALWAAPFAELSDGQRQRVLVARALAQEPAVLVLDEPTAFLDAAGRVSLTVALTGLARTAGLSVVASTHDLDLALAHADVVWLVHDGRVRAAAPEDLLLDGSLAAAFATADVDIDAATGAMRARRPPGPIVVVHGDGLPARLAARAARRLGAAVVAPAAAPPPPAPVWHVRVEGDRARGPTWLLRPPPGSAADPPQRAPSLTALARLLRSQLPPPADAGPTPTGPQPAGPTPTGPTPVGAGQDQSSVW